MPIQPIKPNTNSRPFTRVPYGGADLGLSNIVNDVYDKLAGAFKQIDEIRAQLGDTGAADQAEAKTASIESVEQVPSPNDGSEDGALVTVSPDTSLPGTLYRFSKPDKAWVGPLLGSAIRDTHSARGDFSPQDYEGALYIETDRSVLYYSDGSDWIYLAGVMGGTAASRPADLGTTDDGFVYWATDTTAISRWDGSGWSSDIT